ncbi:hypothetical protein EDB92DRAFT_1886962 [Lactarius akahatsu]|uniref:Uncharacterized protein n=1 Tax=Lactarius akahatsu TaxID=416441 RepID=A0AAD4LAI7_9AGAM|nr:hypothetical protein EDB92DRAFT_1886962 [Lactarius akahatsu]
MFSPRRWDTKIRLLSICSSWSRVFSFVVPTCSSLVYSHLANRRHPSRVDVHFIRFVRLACHTSPTRSDRLRSQVINPGNSSATRSSFSVMSSRFSG